MELQEEKRRLLNWNLRPCAVVRRSGSLGDYGKRHRHIASDLGITWNHKGDEVGAGQIFRELCRNYLRATAPDSDDHGAGNIGRCPTRRWERIGSNRGGRGAKASR